MYFNNVRAFGLNWNFEVLVFEERGKPEYPEKHLSEKRREPTTNATHIWESNPGHIGGRRVLSPLCPWFKAVLKKSNWEWL